MTPELLQLLTENARSGHRPLLFANARIITTDPLIGELDRADLLLGGSRIVGIGPGLLTAAEDDNAIVIDCAGTVVVPVVLDTAALSGLLAGRPAGSIAPGNPASFAVVETVAGEPAADVLGRLVAGSAAARIVVLEGSVLQWAGRPVVTPPATRDRPAESESESGAVPAELLGTWIDETDFVHQHLTADGRYDETRGGREHAFQGAFWIDGDRIDYRDDLGFWAFGEFSDGALHHAGYTFHRA